MQVNMLEAKNQLSRLVKAAQAGEEVIIANHGVPAVKLQAVNPLPLQSCLADDLADLRALLAHEDTELVIPVRANRASSFADDHVFVGAALAANKASDSEMVAIAAKAAPGR